VRSYGRRRWSSFGGFLMLLAAGKLADAQVTQTDASKTLLPQPVTQAELDLVNGSWGWNANTMVNRDHQGVNLNPPVRYGDYYAPPNYPQFVNGDAINLRGLFKWRKDALDPILDAQTGPGYFSAKCGFTAELVLMGDNCQMQLGWYNVSDPASKTPPTAAEIFPLITGNPLDQLRCVNDNGQTRKTDGFCPLAWDNRHPYDLSIQRWIPKRFPSGDIAQDPHYRGGYIAFALLGNPQKCPQNKFSMFEHNQRNASDVPWVTSLIYHSTLDPSGYYFAFETAPMSAADWRKTPAGTSGADADFNDFVVYVSGLTCPGGNLPCDTGQFGACAVGRTDCAAEGQNAVCRASVRPRGETCDNVDNDCDGVVDNGSGLCWDANKPMCFRGACVESCKNGAFPCPTGFNCNGSGECVEASCASLSCPPGSTCRNGACTDEPCAGVICPVDLQCELGRCVDPCTDVTCPSNLVCDHGRCIADCSCNGCDTGLTCGANGRCVDATCANVACLSGTVCRQGVCVDPCASVVCPGKGMCSGGVCLAPISFAGAGGSAGGLVFGGDSGSRATGGTAAGGAESAGAFAAGAAGEDASAGTASATAGRSARGGAPATGGATATSGAPAASGATAAGGVENPGAARDQSSGCGCVVPASEQPPRAWPVLGVLFGFGLLRRRRALLRHGARFSNSTTAAVG